VLTFRKPSSSTIRGFLITQGKLDLSYAPVGATAERPPVGFVVDHTRIQLGTGAEDFRIAQTALRQWQQFRLGWLELFPADAPIQAGSVVAVLARSLGGWWLNSCRIVYVVDDVGPKTQAFGFAYGTLPDHAESGEERFLVEWDRESDVVWFDVLAFSRPQHPLARIGYPWTRKMQKRFARDAAAAMKRAVIQA
jgi:uncharacterized protein (UPF0548 family)